MARSRTLPRLAAGLAALCVAAPAEAATLRLKSGKEVEGEIVERTDDHVRLKERDGVAIIYYHDEIAQIDEDPAPDPSQPPAPTPVPPRTFQTAVARYRLEGDLEGTEALYLNGPLMALERTLTKRHGRPARESIRLIDDGRFLYRVDLLSNTAEQLPILGGRGITGYLEEEEAASGLSMVREGDCLGRPCRIYELSPARQASVTNYTAYHVAFHRGLLLRKEIEASVAAGVLATRLREVREATKLDFDVPVPADAFTVPRSVAVKDLSGLARELHRLFEGSQQNYLESLRDNPVYAPLIEQATDRYGRVDVEKFRQLLEQLQAAPAAPTGSGTSN